MKRVFLAVVLLLVAAEWSASEARRRVVRRTPHPRTVVVVHRGWPLHRPARRVVIRPARTVVRVTPVVYLAPVVWAPVAVVRPAADVLVWEDAETLVQDEDWTELTLSCDARGRKLYLEVASGKVQGDWAEVVFENGDTQVVDFDEKTYGPGFYELLDFRDGRKVDHVRVVARARTGEARVVLRLER
jgi:hypothetical protein